MADKDALLAEYKICNDIIIASANRCWQSGSLLLGFALTAAVLVFTKKDGYDTVGAFLVSFVALSIIFALFHLWRFLGRESWRHELAYWRMRQIEEVIGCWIITGIDDFDRRSHNPGKKVTLCILSASDPELAQSYDRHYRNPAGWDLLRRLIGVVGFVWLLVFLWAWQPSWNGFVRNLFS